MRRAVPVLLLVFVAILMFPGRSEAALAEWKEPLEKAEALVKAGDYEQAELIAHKVADEVARRFGASNKGAEALGVAVTIRGLAAVGMGDLDHGVWLWHTALNIDPFLKELDLEPYKGPGAFLAKHPLKTSEEVLALVPRDLEASRVQPPKVRKRKSVRFPGTVSALHHRGPLTVAFLVREDGVPTFPIVEEQPPPATAIYAALEGIWTWTIDPGRIDGKPIPILYRLTMDFSKR